MKKASLFLLPALLLGCDKTPTQEVLIRPCCDMEEKIGTAKLRFDGEKIFLVVKDNDILLTEENKPELYSGVYRLELSGVLPETGEKIYVGFGYDANNRYLTYVNVSDKPRHSYSVDVLTPVELPQYPVPSAVRMCVDEIQDKVFVMDDKLYVSYVVTYHESRLQYDYSTTERQYKLLPYDDAIKISKNWDWKKSGIAGIKLYSNRGDNYVVEEWEKDACDVLERLNTYIAEQGYDKPIIKYIDEMRCENAESVNLICFMQSEYMYMTLDMCNNGNNFVRPRRTFHPYELRKTVNSFGATEYVAMSGDIENFKILYQPDKADGFKYMYQESGLTGDAYTSCYETEPLLEHNFCALDIRAMTRINDGGTIDLVLRTSYPSGDVYTVTLTQEQALYVTKNWDYNNMKLYQYGNESHEYDACDVRERLWNLENAIRESQDK